MRKHLWPVVLLSAVGAGAAPLEPGAAAPEFSARASNGKTVKLSDFKGKTVVLAFFPKVFSGG